MDDQGENIAGPSRLTVILATFQTGTSEKRADARARLKELGKTGLTLDEGLEALRAAASGHYITEDFDLVRAALSQPRFAYLPHLVELFPAFSPMSRSLVLKYVASWTEAQAAETYRDIIVRYAGSEALPSLETDGLARKPRHADIIFPAVLVAADHPSLAADFYFLARAYVAAEALDPRLREDIQTRAIRAFDEERAWLIALPEEGGVAWKWDETYQEHRRLTIALLNLFAVKSMDEVIPLLVEALSSRDAVLVDTALHALAHRGHDLPDYAIARVAADPETREPLFELLKTRDELDRMPEDFRTQAALAESAMVIWLCHPSELAAAPDEIELMEVVTVSATLPKGSTDDLDYCMFRFRTMPPHWAADKGWFAGMAGSYLRSTTPTTHGQGPTFSAFRSWEGKTPEEHAIEMVEILGRWRNARRS